MNDASLPAEDQARLAAWCAYPGAQSPARSRSVDAWGTEIRVIEWGEPSDPVLMLVHGGADFARTFDVFGPLLAAGGYRVVSWDHRSHGDSEPAALCSWDADCRDAYAVLADCLSGRPATEKAFAVGHSKGGGLMTQLCVALPERFHCLVNIDGVPAPGGRWRPSNATIEERVEKRRHWLDSFLAHRRAAHGLERKPGTLEELVSRRAKLNPRLTIEWLQYLAAVGARSGTDGWRWKLDPLVRMGNPGPWQPSWNAISIGAVEIPMLAILGRHPEMMGWGAPPEQSAQTLPEHAELEVFDDSGHFVHIEHPQRTAERVLTFLAKHASSEGHATDTASSEPPPPLRNSEAAQRREAPSADNPSADQGRVVVTHGRLRLQVHQLKQADAADQLPLLCVHQLGGCAQDFATEAASEWAGEVWGVDLAGHGGSEWARGGGYAPEWQLGDLNAALDKILERHAQVVLFGAGLGAYLSLLLMGARPTAVAATLLADGRGLSGGGPVPQPEAGIVLPAAGSNAESADPLVLAELSVDIRPPEYTSTFARQVKHLHPRAAAGEPLPIWVSVAAAEAVPWLEEIEPQCRRATSSSCALKEMGAFASAGESVTEETRGEGESAAL